MIDTKAIDYTPLIDRLDSGALKRLSRLTGGPANVPQRDLQAWARKALGDPYRVRLLLSALPAPERSVLSLLNWLGGRVEARVLRAAVLGAGVDIPERLSSGDPVENVISRMLKSALFLNLSDYMLTRMFHYNYRGVSNQITSDRRILAQVDPPKFQPVALEAFDPQQVGAQVQTRAPRLLTMQLVGLLQGVDRLNGLHLTQSGSPRVVEMRKLAKLVDWPDGSLQDGSLKFHNALGLVTVLLASCGALKLAQDEHVLRVSASGRELANSPVSEQARLLVLNMLENNEWFEGESQPEMGYRDNYVLGRAALLALLASIPVDQTGFISAASLNEAFYQRMAPWFSLRHTLYYAINTHPSKYELGPSLRQNWQRFEYPWMLNALSQWLYFFGLVDLALGRDNQVLAFRLTDLGRSVLHPELAGELEPGQPKENGIAWVIQPNFDVVAYLDRLSNWQLAFLERHAERMSVQEHLVQYHLTRDSVYRGLEGGTKLDDLLAELEKGAGRELPQNVAAELREWAAQRERVVLWRRGTLAEFPDEHGREMAMRAGLKGQPVGERFLLVDAAPGRPLSRLLKQTVNYNQAAHRNLEVDEVGSISFHQPMPDLLLDARLDAWTTSNGSGERRFTRESVRAGIEAGRSLPALLKLLDERQYRIIPTLFRLTLRAWAGEAFNVGLGELVVLRVPYGELTYAIQQSERLRKYLVSTVTPGIFLVRAGQEEELRRVLEEMGLSVGEAQAK